jgi:lipid II:glycine glycyltransferase (peptidoglycan interpeptide bridge formation enzyme)
LINYLTHEEIDKAKWDECMDQSLNSFMYGYSWYLDEAAPGWDALVLDDYEAVLPLTHKKKYSFEYLYQPLLTQQLGLFYKTLFGREQLAEFIKAVPKKFKLIDICLNETNELEDIPLIKRKNYVLDLERPYPKLLKNYSDHTKRNVSKAKKNNLHIESLSPDEVVDLYLKNKSDDKKRITLHDYDRVRNIIATLQQRNILTTLGVFGEKHDCLSAGIFALHKHRLIYLMGTTNSKGKELRAMYLLFDHIIQRHSEQHLLLDFEGSDVEGVARFFKGFDSKKQPYFKWVANRLPWYIKWLKK